MIPAYLDQLANTLRFDRALSRCVVQEVEDHLREAIAADPAPDRLEAERRAIRNFGEPQLLAAQFAVVSLARRTRRLGIAVVLAIVAVLAAMKARVAWYAALLWSMSDDVRPLAAIVLTIDRLRSGLRPSSGSRRCSMSAAAASRVFPVRNIAGKCAARGSCAGARLHRLP
jgi:HAAS domain-containing protein